MVNWLFPGKYSNKTVQKQKRKHFINDFTLSKQQSNFPLADAMYSPVVLTHAPFRKDKVRVTLVCIASVLIEKFVCTFTCFMLRVRIQGWLVYFIRMSLVQTISRTTFTLFGFRNNGFRQWTGQNVQLDQRFSNKPRWN